MDDTKLQKLKPCNPCSSVRIKHNKKKKGEWIRNLLHIKSEKVPKTVKNITLSASCSHSMEDVHLSLMEQEVTGTPSAHTIVSTGTLSRLFDLTKYSSTSCLFDEISAGSIASLSSLESDSTESNSSPNIVRHHHQSSLDIESSGTIDNDWDSDRSVQDSSTITNKSEQSQHPFYNLEVWLQDGHDLVIRDSCGTSDPYVKFMRGSKRLYRSRTVQKNLNPKWNEHFVLSIENIFPPLQVKVYDYDRGCRDDAMGSAMLKLDKLQPNVPTDVQLHLSERGKNDYMGYIKLQVKLVPKSQDDRDNYFKKTIKLAEKESSARKLKMQMWTDVVTIVLVEGRDLVPMDDNGLSDPYVKFKLGNEKYRSKNKSKTLNPKWLEQFDLRMYQGQTNHLEIVMYDHDVGRDDFMGRALVDLSKLDKETTHMVEVPLEDGAGIIKLLITISGAAGYDTISDLSAYTFSPLARKEMMHNYGFFKSFQCLKDVGWLQVKVYKAQDLRAADIGGKSDPFCVLELVNTRLQTHTEYKTLNPEWNKVFTFNVKDIHSVLEVTVYDEDRDKKVEFLGKVAIPLLMINPGEKRWYALKDKKLTHQTKGSILLELDFIYNHIKAAVRTVNPKEEKYMQTDPKFKISVMKKNIDRIRKIISAFIECGKFVQSCFNWESPLRSITAFVVFIILVWNFEPCMLPLTLLVILLKNVLFSSIINKYSKEPEEMENEDDEDDFDDDDDDRDQPAERKSLKEKLQSAQEICLQVQEGLDVVASLVERIKNTFTWRVPWLTSLAVLVLAVGTLVLYYIPIRVLILAWGINKFTKKLRAPNAIPNNELLDFLSRVPSDRELVEYKELRPDALQLKKKAK